MNANELIGKLENYFDSDYDEIVAMLRHQQAKIDNLYENNARLDIELSQLQAENEALKKELEKSIEVNRQLAEDIGYEQ